MYSEQLALFYCQKKKKKKLEREFNEPCLCRVLTVSLVSLQQEGKVLHLASGVCYDDVDTV